MNEDHQDHVVVCRRTVKRGCLLAQTGPVHHLSPLSLCTVCFPVRKSRPGPGSRATAWTMWHNKTSKDRNVNNDESKTGLNNNIASFIHKSWDRKEAKTQWKFLNCSLGTLNACLCLCQRNHVRIPAGNRFMLSPGLGLGLQQQRVCSVHHLRACMGSLSPGGCLKREQEASESSP